MPPWAVGNVESQDLSHDLLVTLNEIYRLTKALQLTGQVEDTEAEAYAVLMEKREPLVEKFLQLKSKAGHDIKDAQTVKEIIDSIAVLDKEHQKIILQFKESLQASLKGLRSGIKLNTAYSHNPTNIVIPQRLDKQQ